MITFHLFKAFFHFRDLKESIKKYIITRQYNNVNSSAFKTTGL